ncbi:MAG TPA: methylmalonyl-CoA mutase family protein, partial [Agriterribacter sp.]|nr:methylmalonyl-CoA mutase family protein [Agriterribacter sp.]
MNNKPDNKIRIVTAASLFDGHDAAINIMRRILQSKGAEVIHIGHDRAAREIVECAIEEDVQGIALTSYQGGHMEFFKYMKDLLDESGCGHIKIFGGGGGTILPQEAEQLHQYGITRIYSPDDGRKMGLEGMIEEVMAHCSFSVTEVEVPESPDETPPLGEYRDTRKVARAITLAEKGESYSHVLQAMTGPAPEKIPVIGITGTGGAGKSSVTDEIVRRYLGAFADKTIAVISVDPSKKKTGGALLGDRIRMNSVPGHRVYMRSLATREDNTAISKVAREAIAICKAAGYDCIILETAGVGQSDTSIIDYCNVSVYIMTPEYGAASQLEKINMLDYADIIAINKFDKAGAEDALNDVRKQYRRNHLLFTAADTELPVLGICAHTFNDKRVDHFFTLLLQQIKAKTGVVWGSVPAVGAGDQQDTIIIPARRVRYLSEISDNVRAYNNTVKEQSHTASQLYQLAGAIQIVKALPENEKHLMQSILQKQYDALEKKLNPEVKALMNKWKELSNRYRADFLEYSVRGKVIKQEISTVSLSGTRIPRVVLPAYKDWGDIVRWQMQENVPGAFPYTAGVFELKRQGEDPTRMFAGEGGPERTNKRFHYVAAGQPAKRLSTAFDSVTLYGQNPAYRPDIYGKIGNAGVSIATVDDAKKLYSGFNLCDPSTSVS